jgi:hypothetical protein
LRRGRGARHDTNGDGKIDACEAVDSWSRPASEDTVPMPDMYGESLAYTGLLSNENAENLAYFHDWSAFALTFTPVDSFAVICTGHHIDGTEADTLDKILAVVDLAGPLVGTAVSTTGDMITLARQGRRLARAGDKLNDAGRGLRRLDDIDDAARGTRYVDETTEAGRGTRNLEDTRTGTTRALDPQSDIHANRLDSSKTNYGYELRDQTTGDLLKYGETTNPARRYSKKFLDKNNAEIVIIAQGNKRDVHIWQHQRILDYKAQHGRRPPWNKSDW